MKRVLLLVALCLLVATLMPSTASANYWRHCGSQHRLGAGWYHVKAHAIHCGKARSLAHRYSRSGYQPRGWSCTRQRIGIEASRIACRRELGRRVQKVRFSVGA